MTTMQEQLSKSESELNEERERNLENGKKEFEQHKESWRNPEGLKLEEVLANRNKIKEA